jgi:beta-glucosidase
MAEVLVGDRDPGGRLPVTFPLRIEDHPAAKHYPGTDGVMTYGEGVLVGHRGYAAAGTDVLFPFGHGLSYATFDFGAVTIEGDAAGADLVARVPVTNTANRAGSTVVQIYARRPDQVAPVLAGFAKVHLGAGESTVADVLITARTLAEWGDEGWVSPLGPVVISAGSSSRDLSSTRTVELR